MKLPFISVSAPSIVSGMSGESEKTLRDTFDEAKVKKKKAQFLHLSTPLTQQPRKSHRVSSSWMKSTPSPPNVKMLNGRWNAVSSLSS